MRVSVNEEPRVHIIFLPGKRKLSLSFGVANEEMILEAERSDVSLSHGQRMAQRQGDSTAGGARIWEEPPVDVRLVFSLGTWPPI